MDEDLFSLGGDAPAPRTLSDRNVDHRAPLAVRMRPRTLEEIVGQHAALEPGSPLRRLVSTDDSRTAPSSVILWGPPGTGKTTLAYVVAQSGDREFVEVSAVLAGVKDIRDVVDQARSRLRTVGRETVLFVDEVHRFSKSQQDALLPSVENRWVTLVAATTENPYFSVISPLLSRSIVLTLEPLAREDLDTLVDRALTDERGLGGAVTLTGDAREALLRLGGGDARKILTSLEAATAAAVEEAPVRPVDVDVQAARREREFKAEQRRAERVAQKAEDLEVQQKPKREPIGKRLRREAGGEGDGVLLRDADVEGALRELLGEGVQAGAGGHRAGDADEVWGCDCAHVRVPDVVRATLTHP